MYWYIAAKVGGTASHEYPTKAFHASITNPFGKGALINLLRQFAKVVSLLLHNFHNCCRSFLMV